MINEILEYNKKFVENKEYEKFITSKYPDKKIAILTCMDTRFTAGSLGHQERRCEDDQERRGDDHESL